MDPTLFDVSSCFDVEAGSCKHHNFHVLKELALRIA